MTAQYARHEAPPAEISPARSPELGERRCARCGRVGTHFLTCTRLRLPSGYRFSEDDPPLPPGQAAAWAPAPRRPTGGPGHPDWPRPPQQ